jgi:hypothetical protein
MHRIGHCCNSLKKPTTPDVEARARCRQTVHRRSGNRNLSSMMAWLILSDEYQSCLRMILSRPSYGSADSLLAVKHLCYPGE